MEGSMALLTHGRGRGSALLDVLEGFELPTTLIRPVLLTECEGYAMLKESAWPKHAISKDVLCSGWRA